MDDHKTIKALVKTILQNPLDMDWSIQGLGMLRLYLDGDKIQRLHIWCPSHAVENVSTMHTHPWSFSSLIVAGEINQVRYIDRKEGRKVHRQIIQCGENGCLKGEPDIASLLPHNQGEFYEEGQSYHMHSVEIHESFPREGSVSIITRTFHGDTEHAEVFWDLDKEWISAEPRKATREEIRDFTETALENWF